VSDVVEILKGLNGGVIHAALFLAAFFEYVFPPFPGDIAVLFGVFLAVWRGESAAAVFLSTLAGSVAGAAIVWRIGWWLHGVEERGLKPGSLLDRIRPTQEHFDRFTGLVEKYGPAIIMANRFFPGIRAFFILAAGMARIPFWKTMAYATVSAAAWNAMLFFMGKTAGDNWETLAGYLRTYSAIAGAAASVIIVAVIAVCLVRRKRR
jgi:membrane protein DedA with SNARE-associated domain